MSGAKYQQWADYEYLDEIPVSVSVEEEEDEGDEGEDEEEYNNPHNSVSTYASTTSKIDDAPEEPVFEVDDREESFPSDALASTPSSFANLFPSTRRLLIRHDDATIDGNMNLRVDTVVPCRDGYQQDVILFHLRMYDLFSRKCSFRRYCRDSGREVCHTSRKEATPHHERPVFRRSWSSMLASFRPSSSGSNSHHGHALVADHLKRRDSGFGPGKKHDPRGMPDEAFDHESSSSPSPHDRQLADTILLEFSNYAHVELKRRGGPGARRYEYEYWSTRYQWRRECRREGDLREVSYSLVDMRSSKTVAHMVPDILTPLEAVEEESKGGWVPPSSLWISDPAVYEQMPDVAE